MCSLKSFIYFLYNYTIFIIIFIAIILIGKDIILIDIFSNWVNNCPCLESNPRHLAYIVENFPIELPGRSFVQVAQIAQYGLHNILAITSSLLTETNQRACCPISMSVLKIIKYIKSFII